METNGFLNTIKDLGGQSVWTSGTGIGGQANTFRWSDGSYVEDGFTYWQNGQPYHPTPNHKSCISMNSVWNFLWNDVDCTGDGFGLCSFSSM